MKPAEGESSRGKLSAGGRVRRWVVGKPSLAADVSSITKEEDTSPNVWGVIGRLLLLLAALLFSVGLASWFVLSLTVLPAVQVADNMWVAKRGVWTEGSAPQGANVIVLDGQAPRSLWERALLPFIPQDGNYVGQVVAGPYDAVNLSSGGTVVVNGADSGLLLAPPGVLPPAGAGYLIVCQEGDCQPGMVQFAAPGDVLGEVARQTSFPALGAAVPVR